MALVEKKNGGPKLTNSTEERWGREEKEGGGKINVRTRLKNSANTNNLRGTTFNSTHSILEKKREGEAKRGK